MQVFVHIGTHKTGSTSIQAFLRDNAARLAASGFFVPSAGVPACIGAGHHNVAWQLCGDPRYRQADGDLRDVLRQIERSRLPRAILSSEDFESLVARPRDLASFDRAFRAAGHSLRYVAFFRSPDDYALSLFRELRKHGYRGSFRAFICEIADSGRFASYGPWYFEFDHRRFARAWQAVCGRTLVARSYDEASRRSGVIPEFLRLIGAPDPLVDSARAAPRLGVRRRRLLDLPRRVLSRTLRYRFQPPTAYGAGEARECG